MARKLKVTVTRRKPKAVKSKPKEIHKKYPKFKYV